MVLTSGIVGYWKFTDATDSVSTNDLTVNGATSGATGIIGDCYSYDGTNDYLIDTSPTGISLTDFTVSCWINATSLVNAKGVFVLKTAGSSYAFDLYYSSVAGLNAYMGTASVVGDATFSTTGSWVHVVVTRSGTDVEMFINNSSVDTGTSSQSLSSVTSILVGSQNESQSTWSWDGLIDEIGVWNRQLTGAEITELYNSGAGLQYPFSAGGFSKTINGISSYSKINGIEVANIAKVNGVSA